MSVTCACGRCHTCGTRLKSCLDGEEWCPTCQAYRRYRSHGWSRAAADRDSDRCPDWPTKPAGEEQTT